MDFTRKSMTELRGMAQAMKVPVEWGDQKEVIIQKINRHITNKVLPHDPLPVVHVVREASGPLVGQDKVREALEPFLPLGLVVSFPDEVTFELYCNQKRDSGSLTTPLWNIVQCAKEVVKP